MALQTGRTMVRMLLGVAVASGAMATSVGCVRIRPATDPGIIATPDPGEGSADAKPDWGRSPAPSPPEADQGTADAGPAGPDFGVSSVGPDDAQSGSPDVAPEASADRDPQLADAVVSTPDAADPLLLGLIAHWRFDEGAGTSAADSSGNGNRATLHNGAAWTSRTGASARPGDFAVGLDGVDDHLSVNPAKLPRLEGAKSISFWFSARTDVLPAADGSTQTTCVALLNTAEHLAIQIGTDKGRPAAWHAGESQGFVVAPAIPPTGFRHWGYTFDGTVHRLYVDGQVVGMKEVKPATGPLTSLMIGTFKAPEEMCAGQLDDLRIYDRALAPAEITRLAASP